MDHELKTQLYAETHELAGAHTFAVTDWGVVDTQELWLRISLGASANGLPSCLGFLAMDFAQMGELVGRE